MKFTLKRSIVLMVLMVEEGGGGGGGGGAEYSKQKLPEKQDWFLLVSMRGLGSIYCLVLFLLSLKRGVMLKGTMLVFA